MILLDQISQLSDLGPTYLAVGVFDGVHRGHQAVIRRAVEDHRREQAVVQAAAVVVTFHPHPMKILRPGNAPRLLTSTPHKLQFFAALGATHCLTLAFDTQFAATAPEDFIAALGRAGRPLREVCVGFNWSFGRGRAGNLDLLTRLGERFGFAVVGLPSVVVDGETVSSTLIRQAVERGDWEKAARMLGREFSVLGTVVRGQQLGRQLGFPTANLAAHNEQFPPDGVYAVVADWRGATYPGVVNLGVRPTVAQPGGERLLELHLLDFAQEIYGEDVEVRFRQFLRPEQKFADLEELRTQIARDVATARAVLAAADQPTLARVTPN
ncbi:MAG: bifunctional riboflavin kinase/FAD synthetase [Verrucomicrobia bacterium]|nr:bifunctional riboflavin kinase/FAD synthetase [Verrucomicrobiota bacterium]